MKNKILLLLLVCCQCQLLISAELVPDSYSSDKSVLTSRYLQCIYPVWENGKIRLINYHGDYINEHSYDVPPILQAPMFIAHDNSQIFLKRDGRFYRIHFTGKEFPLTIPKPYEFKKYLGNDRFLAAKKDRDLELCRVYSSPKNDFITDDFIWHASYDDDIVIGYFDIDFEEWRKYTHDLNAGLGGDVSLLVKKLSAVKIHDGTKIPCPENHYPMFCVGGGMLRATFMIDDRGIDSILNYHGDIVFESPNMRLSRSYKDGRIIATNNNDLTYSIVDLLGNIVFQSDCEISGFSCGRAKIEKRLGEPRKESPLYSSLVGYVNRFGEEVIPCQYIKGTNFHDDLAIVQDREKKYHLINTYGDVLKDDLFADFPQNVKSSFYNIGSIYNIDSMLSLGVSWVSLRPKKTIITEKETQRDTSIKILLNFDGKEIWRDDNSLSETDSKNMFSLYSTMLWVYR